MRDKADTSAVVISTFGRAKREALDSGFIPTFNAAKGLEFRISPNGPSAGILTLYDRVADPPGVRLLIHGVLT